MKKENGKNYMNGCIMNKETVCFVAGKSGGHIIPCLTLAEQHCTMNPHLNILFFSSNTPLDKLIISNNKLISQHIMLTLVSANPTSFFNIFTIAWNTLYSFCISLFYLYKNSPAEIITTGGVVALPVCIAGFLLKIPITIYNLDAVPGKAIKALIPFATTIMVCFKNSQHFFPAQKCAFAPYPIRYSQTTVATPQETKKTIEFDEHKKTIVVLGGSQGSVFLNSCIKEWVTSCAFAPQIQIIHQTGTADSIDWKNFYAQHGITAHVFSYNPNLAPFYTVADLTICRAGAGTLFEIEFFKKQCLIIPLRSPTTTHQVDNARAISQEYPHLFTWMDQRNIEEDVTLFFCKVNELLRK